MTDVKSPSTRHVIRIPRQTRAPDVFRVPSDAANVLVHVEAGAEAVVAMCVLPGLSGLVVEVVLEEGARLELLRVVDPGADGACESRLQARQANDSSLRAFFVTKGGRALKDHVLVALEGQGAEVFLNGLHHLAGDAEAQSHTYVDHVAPSTMSNQLYKSILRDKSHSVFNGKIMVRREAQLTNSYQLNKNLLLSPDARVDTKPQLEIFADDVKCSHGAAIGQLDDEQLFYLQTRGIDKSAAGEMLVHGFVQDVLDQIRDPRLRQEAENVLKGGVDHV
jgi:Fe-S cluster assembly protein SufD